MITRQFNDPILEYAAAIAARHDMRMEDDPAAAGGGGAPGSELSDTEIARGPNPIKSAGAEFLKTLTADQLETELGTEEDGEINSIPAEGKPKKRTPRAKAAPADPATPAGQKKGKPAATTTPRGKDGKFAEAGTVTDPDEETLTDEQLESLTDEQLARIGAGETFAAVTASADDEELDEDEDPETGKGKGKGKPKAGAKDGDDDEAENVIVLKGLDDRGEEDLELEVADPEVAERIRRLQNDGLRRADYNERLESVEARDEELRRAEAMIEANPIGFVLEMMGEDRQLDVARALIAEHFEVLAPLIETFYDKPEEVPKAQLKARDEAKKNTDGATRKIQAQNAARAIERSVRELIPESVDRRTAERFMRDAERDLLDAVSSGERVSPTTAAHLLKERVRMYGFSSEKVKGKDSPAGARPLSDRAKTLADRRSKASDTQSRIKRVQLQRKNGASIAPPGAGGSGATVREPLIKKGATIEEASRAIRSKGMTSWADIQRG